MQILTTDGTRFIVLRRLSDDAYDTTAGQDLDFVLVAAILSVRASAQALNSSSIPDPDRLCVDSNTWDSCEPTPLCQNATVRTPRTSDWYPSTRLT